MILSFIQDYSPPPPPPQCGVYNDVWCGPVSVAEPGTMAVVFTILLCSLAILTYWKYSKRSNSS
jgi:hypothetical protein